MNRRNVHKHGILNSNTGVNLSSTLTFTSDHIYLYHRILEKEVQLYGKVYGSSNEALECNRQKLCIPDTERILSKCLSFTEIKKIAKTISNGDILRILNDLINEGLIINLGGDCYRSFHMDLLIRSLFLPLAPGYPSMMISGLYYFNLRPIPFRSEQNLLPRPNGSEIEQELYKNFNKVLGSDLAKIFINTLNTYFNLLGSKGLSKYQARALLEYLKNIDTNTIVITAPTGSGKTEIFIIIVLLEILRKTTNNKFTRKSIIIYPRKMLEENQAQRLITLLYYLNKYLEELGFKPITLYIRDGNTRSLEEDARFYGTTSFRGLTFEGKKLMVNANGAVTLENTGEEFKFIVPFRHPEAPNANIILTTIHTLLYRALSSRPTNNNDIYYRTILATDVYVIDEAHEYDPLLLGNFSYLMASVKALSRRKPKLIISSATLPNYIEFSKKLSEPSGNTEVLDLSYDTIRERGGVMEGEKAELTLFIKTRPDVSWATYVSELGLYLLYLGWASKLEHKRFIPQSIIFINNIRELNRTASILEQAASLGSPTKKSCLQHKTNMPKKYCDPFNPQSLVVAKKIYPSASEKAYEILSQSGDSNNLSSELIPLSSTVFSGLSHDKRSEIYNKFTNKELLLLLATSSLELGVDYPNVTLIVNVGFDRSASLIQRFGRGGRSPSSLYTSLNILIARNNPLDYVRFSNLRVLESIGSGRLETLAGQAHTTIPMVGIDVPALKVYALLRHLLLLSYVNGDDVKIRYRGLVNENTSIVLNKIRNLINNLKIEEEIQKYLVLTGINNGFLNELKKDIENLADKLPELSVALSQLEAFSIIVGKLRRDINSVIEILNNIKNIFKDKRSMQADMCSIQHILNYEKAIVNIETELENAVLNLDQVKRLKSLTCDISGKICETIRLCLSEAFKLNKNGIIGNEIRELYKIYNTFENIKIDICGDDHD